ncbi:MAG TPA: manganese efflux pump [Thermoanaerobaculia bacterium]|nr:manganese efflux pump [Thermoanaerobaculia bacterium]
MLVRVVAFVAPLGLDTFAVAVALGIAGYRPWRPLAVFTVFEAGTPLLGIVLGAVVGRRSSVVAGYLGGLLISMVGFNTLRKTLATGERPIGLDSFKGSLLTGLGISIDDIAIGFPLGTKEFSIPLVIGVIAVQTFVVTGAGVLLGGPEAGLGVASAGADRDVGGAAGAPSEEEASGSPAVPAGRGARERAEPAVCCLPRTRTRSAPETRTFSSRPAPSQRGRWRRLCARLALGVCQGLRVQFASNRTRRTTARISPPARESIGPAGISEPALACRPALSPGASICRAAGSGPHAAA